MEWPSRKQGRPGYSAPTRSRRARTSFTTCLQPSRSANQPNSEGVPRRAAVAQVVVAHDGEAVLRQEAGEGVIPADVFRDAVAQLHHPRGGPSGRHQAAATVGPHRWRER